MKTLHRVAIAITLVAELFLATSYLSYKFGKFNGYNLKGEHIKEELIGIKAEAFREGYVLGKSNTVFEYQRELSDRFHQEQIERERLKAERDKQRDLEKKFNTGITSL